MKRLRKDRVQWTSEMRKKLSKKYKGSGNPMYGKSAWDKGKKRPEISGENHPNWKGGRYIVDNYVMLSNNNHEISEHRKIVENFIGRKLDTTEIIHHINGNKQDNRIENLLITNRKDHMNIHRKDINKKKGK